MSFQYSNGWQTSLAASIGPSDTTLTVASAAGAPSSGNFPVVIDAEIMLCTAIVGNVLTVVRANEPDNGVQVATGHGLGALVSSPLTVASLLAIVGGTNPIGAAGGSLAGTYPDPSIAASGVTAGTYGSATQVAGITIGTDGRITAAANVTISGGGGTPAGSDQNIQINQSGAFGADPRFNFDYTAKTLLITSVNTAPCVRMNSTDNIVSLCNSFSGAYGLYIQAIVGNVSLCTNTQTLIDTAGTWLLAGVPYQWPGSQGAAGSALENDGAGNLSWVVPGGGLTSPLTTKGDLWGYSTTNARVPVGADGLVLTADSTNAEGVSWQPVTAAAGGSDGQIQVNASGVLAGVANLTLSAGGNTLGMVNAGLDFAIKGTYGSGAGLFYGSLASSSLGGLFQHTPFEVDLCSSTYACQFTDGTRFVTMCDGTNHITYGPATPGNWASAAPTDVWVALDRIVAWILANVGTGAWVTSQAKP